MTAMPEAPDDIPESTSTKALVQYLPADPYLTSAPVGWENMLLRCYRFPPQPDGITLPRIPDHTLILHLGKSVSVKRQIKEVNSWKESVLFPGAFTIWPAKTASTWAHTETTETLHLHVRPRFIQQAAEAKGKSGFSLAPCLAEVDPVAEHALLTLKAFLERPDEAKDVAAYAENLVRLLAKHLAGTYGRRQMERRSLPGELSRPKLRRVSEYVRAHLGEEVLVEDMAAVVSISPHHFSRLFRATTGETPRQFVMRHRLEEAERLLLETDEKIAGIAGQVGYRDASHFASIFRRRTGFTPREYRRQHGA